MKPIIQMWKPRHRAMKPFPLERPSQQVAHPLLARPREWPALKTLVDPSAFGHRGQHAPACCFGFFPLPRELHTCATVKERVRTVRACLAPAPRHVELGSHAFLTFALLN